MDQSEPGEIYFYKNYFNDFFRSLRTEVQAKLNWTLQLIISLDRIPTKYFEHITDPTGLYEIRVECKSEIFRVFAFFDEGNIIVVTSGFQKKTPKTPRSEILRAEKIKKQYFDEKSQ